MVSRVSLMCLMDSLSSLSIIYLSM
jgi:hypothetical protein